MKNETKHTPGPWYIHKDYFDNPTGDNKQIMYKSGHMTHKSLCRVIQNPADAQAISAVPTMINRLTAVVEIISECEALGCFNNLNMSDDQKSAHAHLLTLVCTCEAALIKAGAGHKIASK